MRLAASIGAFLLALALAGCGGAEERQPGSALSLVPADAEAYVSIDADSEHWDELVAALPAEVADLREAAGPTVDIAYLDEGVVGFTQPEDEEALRAALDELEVAEIGGWTVFAKKPEAIAAVRDADASLEGSEPFAGLIAKLPADAIARGFVAPRSIPLVGEVDGASFGVAEGDDGLDVVAYVRGIEPGSLTELAPADAVAVLSVRQPDLAGLELPFVPRGDVLVYARPAGLAPEITLVAEEGGPLPEEIPLGMVTLFSAEVDGRLVVSTLRSGIDAVRDESERFSGEDVVLFVDVAAGLPLAELLAGFFGHDVPERKRDALEPFGSVTVFADR